ncbi:hypothetical protein PHMEG_00035618 [Phytophthora megakarya]|uniref:Uncharacterized protein n=1 Tax=Phytophthora megakarya TaxID=4795 RepID=A0A225UNM8_9STRA|nr:hypothetical protein PHMEG_00035618 [Phytophthora megakarya]
MAHVASCRYLRLECSEDDHPLFRREYARNNRERGVKSYSFYAAFLTVVQNMQDGATVAARYTSSSHFQIHGSFHRMKSWYVHVSSRREWLLCGLLV